MSETQIEEVPFLSNAGFMLTYKCTIACPHCIVNAGPHRKEEMSIESAFNWLDQLKAYRDGFVRGISLTGGEPFYNLDHMLKVADYAKNLGFIISVVSNAYWASTKEEALRVLRMCSSIQMISISADVPHQKLIPFENVRNAIWAAKKLGKLYNIAVATEYEEDPAYLSLMDSILEITDLDYINTAIILPVGRAEKEGYKKNYHFDIEPACTACSMASFPVIFPNGKVIGCIGPPIKLPIFNPLYLGNLQKESITEIFDRAESNYTLHAIRTYGPKVLVDMLREHGYGKIIPENFIKDAICDVCFRLFSDKTICRLIDEIITNDEKFRMKVAYGRYYHMHEDEMLKKDFHIENA